jgi:VanZ family protein
VISLWLPVAICMVAVYIGAALPPSAMGPAAGIPDTVMHMLSYAVVALVTLRATAKGRWAGVTPAALWLAFAIAVAHGATVEIEQMFVPQRVAEWRDLANDTCGTALGLLIAWGWSKIKG